MQMSLNSKFVTSDEVYPMTSSVSSPKQWHIGNWTGLGWLETGIKLVAHIVAFIALIWAIQHPAIAFRFWGGIYDLQVMILGVMALGLTFAIADRYMEKETLAMIFVISNVIAHWGMVYALTFPPSSGSSLYLVNYQPQDLLGWQLLPIFAALTLLGDLVKIVFLLRTKFTVRGYSPRMLVYLTGFSVIGYAILLLIWLITLSNPWIGR
jgi:hypothetical protein